MNAPSIGRTLPTYSIEARSFRVAFACSHNFWVLKDHESGAAIAELHGLAYDRVRRIILPIGTNRQHGLRVFVFAHDEQYAATLGVPLKSTRMFARSRTCVVHTGPDGRARWDAAVAAMPLLDRLDLDYPPYGFSVIRPTVNSNSAYRTFGDIMGVAIPSFGGALAPGARQGMISRSALELLKYQPERGHAATT